MLHGKPVELWGSNEATKEREICGIKDEIAMIRAEIEVMKGGAVPIMRGWNIRIR